MRHDFFKNFDFTLLDDMDLPHKEKLKLSVFYLNSPNKKKIELKSQNNMRNSYSEEVVVLKEGIVKKKSPWFHYNTRKLVLYNNHKLEYIDPNTNNARGVIILTKECKSFLMESERFDLITPCRTFVFRVNMYFIQTDNSAAQEWNKLINSVIENLN